MNALNIILQILLLVAGVFLVVAVLLQRAKTKGGLSGAIAGGVDTFFGKEQGPKVDRLLNRLTIIVAIVFVLFVVVVYVIQPDYASSTFASSGEWKHASIFSGALEHSH